MRTNPDNTANLMTSVTPAGRFLVGLHRPSFKVANLREQDFIGPLGHTSAGETVENTVNFPAADISIPAAKPIYEICNAFPFRGTTYIDSEWADARADNPGSITLPPLKECSLRKALGDTVNGKNFSAILADLPQPVLYALAANSTDPEELVSLVESCCRLEYANPGQPTGLVYIRNDSGNIRPDIDDFELFETIANNPYLPDSYKQIMVLRPGVQGSSEIVGEWTTGSHVFEYLRSNSYIPGGHYASNLADDRIRYRTADLTSEDMRGLRHLYYQRTYVALAERMGLEVRLRRRTLEIEELEDLRLRLSRSFDENSERMATLWGWNFGYDISPSGYRLHASHQMIHQQYALVPETVRSTGGEIIMPSFSCGDLVADTLKCYAAATGSDFFRDFLTALSNNVRTDGKEGEHNLVVWKDANVILYVPKAQVSQWEIQLMVTADSPDGPVGNVVEADSDVRSSIDQGILTAQKIYAGLNARMVTSIEFPKRIGVRNGQRLFYSFLPKLPWSMGAFSEAQLRFICGHYPEDFATCCRRQLDRLTIA